NQGKGNSNKTKESLSDGSKRQVQGKEDNHKYNGQNHQESSLPTDEILILTAPFEIVSRRQLLHPFVQYFHCLFDRATEIAPPDVEKNGATKHRIIGYNHCRSIFKSQLSHLRQRDRPHLRSRNG